MQIIGQTIGGLPLLSGLMLVAFMAGRASVPAADGDIALQLATLEAHLAESRAEAAFLHARLAHVDELALDRLAEMEAAER